MRFVRVTKLERWTIDAVHPHGLDLSAELWANQSSLWISSQSSIAPAVCLHPLFLTPGIRSGILENDHTGKILLVTIIVILVEKGNCR